MGLLKVILFSIIGRQVNKGPGGIKESYRESNFFIYSYVEKAPEFNIFYRKKSILFFIPVYTINNKPHSIIEGEKAFFYLYNNILLTLFI